MHRLAMLNKWYVAQPHTLRQLGVQSGVFRLPQYLRCFEAA